MSMASALDQFRSMVLTYCKQDYTDALIVRGLHAAGCPIGRERIRVWLQQ